MTRLRTVRAESRGMSLVEILVTVFVLAVGLLAVIRILIPGLAVLPRTNMEAKAMQAASAVAKAAENAPDFRPDAIAYGVRTDPRDPRSPYHWDPSNPGDPNTQPSPAAGWIVRHDVSMGDADQVSLTQVLGVGSHADPAFPDLWDKWILEPQYPNVVIGEIIEVPMQLQVAMLECGPYVEGTLKVYYPEPYTQVPSLPTTDPDPSANSRTFAEAGGVLTLDGHPGLATIPGFVVCYSAVVGGVLYDIVGEEIVQAGNQVDLTPSLARIGGGTLVPNSVTLYEMAPGVADDSTSGAMGRRGCVGFIAGCPEPGTRLACAYEMQPHDRARFDDITVTTFPLERDLPNSDVPVIAVPDIQHYDTYVPLDGEGGVKLPVEAIVRTDANGAPVLLDWNVDTLAAVGDENVRVVNRLTGAMGTATAGTDGFIWIDPADTTVPPGCPVRIYYRVPSNWALERHVAAANYAFLDMNGIVYPTPTFVPESSRGLKQFWYSVSTDTAGYWTLVFYNSGPLRVEDYWAAVAADPTSPPPPPLPEEDGQRISVDYRYTDAAGDVQRVTGETHLVDFASHGFTLHQPDVLAIDAVRGASYKVRVCFDGLDGKRRRVDVDTIVMR